MSAPPPPKILNIDRQHDSQWGVHIPSSVGNSLCRLLANCRLPGHPKDATIESDTKTDAGMILIWEMAFVGFR
jgi:hypothetical protein